MSNQRKNIAVLGSLWGDEGKGHITHHLSPGYDWVVRFGGGANAGHTIYRNGKKYVHNLLPSIDFRHEHVRGFLGSGMVLDLEQLLKEVTNAEEDFPGVGSRLVVDPDAFVVLPEHKEQDKAKNAHIGSTNRGIGPAYADKVMRQGVRVIDLIIKKNFTVDALKHLGVQFKSSLELQSEFARSRLLFEGAQGVLLDLNHGIYPYVSCGDATVAGITACGFASVRLDKVYGVAKCYTTKVGEGPFPTELHGDEAEALRKRGNEYGATTGRPRRVGWLDLPALKYACAKGGIDTLIVTKFDILAGMDEIPVARAYEQEIKYSKDFFEAKPQYVNVKGWKGVKDDESFQGMIDFIDFIEEEIHVPVEMISRGTNEEDILDV
jgi:adenylosuccinate synthase